MHMAHLMPLPLTVSCFSKIQIVRGLRGVLCAIICPLILSLDLCRGPIGDFLNLGRHYRCGAEGCISRWRHLELHLSAPHLEYLPKFLKTSYGSPTRTRSRQNSGHMIAHRTPSAPGLRLVLSFWYRLTHVVLDKGPLNGCMCIYLVVYCLCIVFATVRGEIKIIIFTCSEIPIVSQFNLARGIRERKNKHGKN